jgi:flagellar biosynthetic protein FliR
MISFTSVQLDAWFGAYFWPFVRILALFSSAPLLYHRAIPHRLKIAFAAIATLVIAPSLPPASGDPAWLLVQQLLIGLAIGLGLQLVFAAFEVAGDLLGLQMGLSFASFIDPQNSKDTPLIGGFLGLMATLVFLAINGHLLMIAGIADSFRALPVGAGAPVAADMKSLALLGGEMFSVGLHLALPVLATMLILNLALGVLARAAPQLNIFAVGFPATILIGLGSFALVMPIMGPFLETALERALALAFQFGR